MKVKYKIRSFITLIVFCLMVTFTQTQLVNAQNTESKPKPKMGFNPFQADPRVKELTYRFQDTDEDLKYWLFVSSKVSKGKKAPLIVTLHGLGAPGSIMVSKPAVDLAEEGGYILVAPMGYNIRGWYGIPRTPFPKSAKTKPQMPQPDNNATPKPVPKMPPGLFFDPNDPPNLRELSEKDVMNVLDIVRREYNVDENRIYLMGHSMGGAGTLHLGVKYSSIWAALAPIAPATGGLDSESFEKIKNIPVNFVHGDTDELLPVTISRELAEKAKEHGLTYELTEIKGAGHGPIITEALPSVYNFFNKHSKGSEKKPWKDIDYVGDGIVGHKLDIYLPDTGAGPYPSIIYIYGSAWFSNNMKGTAGMFSPQLLKAGFAVVAINHRASKEATFPAQIHDAKAAIRFIRANAAKYNLDPSWVGVTGGSSGGHLTALLGTSGGVKKHTAGEVTYDIEGSLGKHTKADSSVQAACDWFGPTDFRLMDSCGSQMSHDAADSPESTLIGGPIQENADKCALANPATYVDAEDPPFLIFHGNKDPLVPSCQSDLLHKGLTEAGVDSTYVQVSRAGHGNGLTTPINLDRMARFFSEALEAFRKGNQ